MKKFLIAVFALVAFVSIKPSFAFEFEKSNREDHKIGFYSGLLSDPVGLLPLNIAYNALPFLRLNVGAAYTYWFYFGHINVATYGGGAKFLVPGWNFSPVLGVNGTGGYGVFEDAGMFDFESSRSTRGDKETASFGFGYLNFGGDYQAANGFNVGFGLNWAFWKSQDVDFKYPLPYLNLGWFF